jgi:hypothetical protein
VQESEFRDWARRAQGSFDERLRVLEGKVGGLDLASPRVRTPELVGSVERLFTQLGEAVRGGHLTALGISYVSETDGVQTGWANEAFDRYALAGAVGQLWLEIMDRAKDEALEAPAGGIGSSAAGAASGGSGGRTDEESPSGPSAREVAASAPAQGIVA